MQKIMTLGFLLLWAWNSAQAQFVLNPQVGSNIATPYNLADGLTRDSKSGWLVGVDLRLGGRVYLQPGAFYSFTQVKLNYNDGVAVSSDYSRQSGKLKALLGVVVVQGMSAKFRMFAGPTCDVHFNINDHDSPFIRSEDAKRAAFNIDMGAGLDFWRFSGEIGYSHGLTNAFKNSNGQFGEFYASVGILIGDISKR
jgi:hypothetical protein